MSHADADAIGREELVAALSTPDAYPDRPSRVAVAETHISRVFLTDHSAYKVKKPVRFPFLDYSTPERRLQACRDEVRLNARLAPGVYRGVLPITLGSDGRIRVGGDGRVIEHCVAMHRLPEERMLDRRIGAGLARPADMERLLDVLVPFYAQAARGPDIDRFATAEAIEHNTRENLSTLEQADHGLPGALFGRVRSSQLHFVKLAGRVFPERIAAGRVCEGHGDLRPEHVCLLDPPVVYDCVEFALEFRAADVISDLAFLAVECDLLDAHELGAALVRGYRARSGDDAPEPLGGFYKSYRACIRGKVEALRAGQQRDEDADRSRARARRYLQRASFYATEFYRPTLLVMVGAAGTGKTTLARKLAEALGSVVFRSDAVRHELAGRRDPDAGWGEGLYSTAMTDRTYAELFRRAGALLRESVSVVLDAGFRGDRQRAAAVRLAQDCGALVEFIVCRCPRDVAMDRVARRRAQGADISDARPELFDLHQQELTGAEDLTDSTAIVLDTTASAPALADRAIAHVARRYHA